MSEAFGSLIQAIRGLLTWWLLVAPWERGVRVRGKSTRILEPGFHLVIPLLDRVYRQSIRTRTIYLPTQVIGLSRGRALTVAAMVSYQIGDLMRVFETMQHPEATIGAECMAAIIRAAESREGGEPSGVSWFDGKLAVDLSAQGIQDVEIVICSCAAVRGYRFITGDGNAWIPGTDPLGVMAEHKAGG